VSLSMTAVLYREADGYVVQCLSVDVASEGDTEQEARDNVIEAVELFFSEPAAKGDYQDIEDAHSEQLTLKKSA
jgi:predicted RNase H-like HicB family nuclease